MRVESMSLRCPSVVGLILAALQTTVAKDPTECTQDVQKKIFGTEEGELNLLQKRAGDVPGVLREGAAEDVQPQLQKGHLAYQEAFCRELTDQGAYHTLVVEVGNPPQEFNLVADTGANTLILPDCKCINSGSCSGIDKCFETHNSESFHLKMIEDEDHHKVPEPATLYFGSGPINCSLSSDMVRIGNATGIMSDALFLMEDRNDLSVTKTFEGLLGLGQPRPNKEGIAETMKKDLFMKKAEVERFSVCFNSDAMGIFRMHVPELKKPMGSIGELHWAFDLQGMSVGSNATAKDVLFCDPSKKRSDQKTACNAVPDSGTTMMLGPRDQILDLFDSVCSQWPRCMEYTKDHSELPKSHAFQNLLSSCRDWMTEDDGINEIPPINLHLGGVDGEPQIFELSAWAWVVETTYPVFVFIQENIFQKSYKGLEMIRPKFNTTNYCSTMFSSHFQDTDINGPQWLFGSPLFFEKVVHFDIGSKPPAMSISSSPCRQCEGEPSLLAESARTFKRGRELRRLERMPRMPHWDFSEPL